MVPVDCAVCQKSVMIWDATMMQCERYEGEFRKEHRVLYTADICKHCLPKDRMDCQGIVPDRNAKVQVVDIKDRSFSAPEDGSQGRFTDRKRDVPWLKHTFWWLVHNCVAHVLIGPLPFGPLFRFHDWTSKKMHGK